MLVIKWPGQPTASGDSRIPSLVAYKNGQAKLYGTEAKEALSNPEYEVARWFKLYLHPEPTDNSDNLRFVDEQPRQMDIPPLPSSVPVLAIYRDLIRYMFEVTRRFFIENTPNGAGIWGRVHGKAILVFCVPNGWDINQQEFLRKAVIKSGIMSRTDAETRVDFVTEGEASVHYALTHSSSTEWLRRNSHILVMDAGGSTVDSTLYKCVQEHPLKLEEACTSECTQTGGVFVDREMSNILRQKLQGSVYGDEDSLEAMIEDFERKAKRGFTGLSQTSVIKFGTPRYNDAEYGIQRGRLSLSNDEVKGAFDGVVKQILDSCSKMINGRQIQHLLLVGGLGYSPYLRLRIKQFLGDQGTEVVVVDEPEKKAAVTGAVIWFTQNLVSGRALRYAIGIPSTILFDGRYAEHLQRQSLVLSNPDRTLYLPSLTLLVRKGAIIEENWEAEWHCRWNPSLPLQANGQFSAILLAWDGPGDQKWLTDPRGDPVFGLRTLSTIVASNSDIYSAMKAATGPTGHVWRLDFSIRIWFKRAQLRAQLVWRDNGQRRTGPVSIIPATKF
ncbi:hypothetical protein FRC19_007138 [Serendipita sp. 401]|nr:hypothetical protein FRC19_007138 [Serendipita sp. 401]KAG9053370.1 hypothetical protein FS842_008283 [Serendipita sp. 407]